MKKALDIVLLVFVGTLMVGIASAAVEVVVNGGFETGDLTGWNFGSPAGVDMPLVTNAIVTSDSSVYCAVFKAGAFVEQVFDPPIVATGELEYRITGAGSNQFQVTATYSDATSDSGMGSGVSVGSWSYVSFDVNNAKAISKIKFTCTGADTHPVYLDRVSLMGYALPGLVIPEVPWGTIVVSASMMFALVGYVAVLRLKRIQ